MALFLNDILRKEDREVIDTWINYMATLFNNESSTIVWLNSKFAELLMKILMLVILNSLLNISKITKQLVKMIYQLKPLNKLNQKS